MVGKKRKSRSRSASPSRLINCGAKPGSKNELLCESDFKLYKTVFSKITKIEGQEKSELVSVSNADIFANISNLNINQLNHIFIYNQYNKHHVVSLLFSRPLSEPIKN